MEIKGLSWGIGVLVSRNGMRVVARDFEYIYFLCFYSNEIQTTKHQAIDKKYTKYILKVLKFRFTKIINKWNNSQLNSTKKLNKKTQIHHFTLTKLNIINKIKIK